MIAFRAADGVLVERFATDKAGLEGKFHPALIASLVDLPDDHQVSWVWNGSAYVDPQNIPPPPPTIEDVRAEAQRRIIALTGASDIIGCLTKQHNAQMRATELTLILALGGQWTAEQAAEAAALQGMADAVKAIRAASNILEPNPPADFASDIHWPQG